MRPHPSSAPLRVLVVDDNRDGADMLGMLLGLWGHDARVAYGGPEALRAAAEFLPHVALLDIAMPGMTGWQLAQELRRLPGSAGCALVAVTGSTLQDHARRSLGAGFHAFLLKPVEPDQLQALLEGLQSALAGA